MFIVTNQSDIAGNIYDEKDFFILQSKMKKIKEYFF